MRGIHSIKDIENRSEPEPNSGCWIWTGCVRNAHNYMQTWVTFHGRQMSASRAAWMLENGNEEITSKQVVCHACNNSMCVNPGHLYLGSAATNVQDSVKAKRARGGFGRLQDSHVIAIRDALRSGFSIPATAALLGVSKRSVERIKYRQRHTNVAGGVN